ncbi:MAG: hypothetical protein HZA14_12005 [Nitrospirae bacterium]|nr:hypothetical protein [Nitrospirota bacterium]
MQDKQNHTGKDSLFGDLISSYTQDEAIDDGFLILTGYVGKNRVVFTRNLFSQGYEDEMKRKELVEKGLELLAKPDSEDTADMRLRVIEEGKIWVIWDIANGFTFLTPEDY